MQNFFGVRVAFVSTTCCTNYGYIWQISKWHKGCIIAPARSQPHTPKQRLKAPLALYCKYSFFSPLGAGNDELFFWWALSLPITVSWGHLAAAYGLKVPFKSARQPFSQTFSQLFTQPAATGNFPAVETGSKKESQLAVEANAASCGL